MARSTRPPSAEPPQGATPAEGREPFLWTAGTGDAAFHGEPGWHTVWLDGLTLPEVLAGISFDEPGLVLRPAGNGTLFVEDAAGWPVLASGRLRTGGGTLRFAGLLCLAFLA